MKLSATVAVGLLLGPSHLAAQNSCFGLADFNAYIYKEGGQLYAIGDTEGNQTQFWTFEDGRFVITYSPTPGIVCLVIGGKAFTVVAVEKPNL